MQTLKTDISVAEAIAAFERCESVRPKRVALYEAIGQRVAEDVTVRRSIPAVPLADIDGWAVVAAETLGASNRKPRLLATAPRLVDSCRPMPAGFDAVVPLETISQRTKGSYVRKPVAVGDGVKEPLSRMAEGAVLVREGQRLTLAAAMSATVCGVLDVMIRQPVIDIIFNSAGNERPNDQLVRMVVTAVRTSGSKIGAIQFTAGEPAELARVLLESSADMICTIGGTGVGPGDSTMLTIAEVGEVVFHGVRVRPGGTVGFGFVGGRPVFASPGRLLDMVAVNIMFSSSFARRIFGRPPQDNYLKDGKLAEGLSAAAGHDSLVFCRIDADRLQPIATDMLGPVQLAQAQAAVFLPAGSRHRRKGETIRYVSLGTAI
jgi:molybdopterin molybdotransferase